MGRAGTILIGMLNCLDDTDVTRIFRLLLHYITCGAKMQHNFAKMRLMY